MAINKRRKNCCTVGFCADLDRLYEIKMKYYLLKAKSACFFAVLGLINKRQCVGITSHAGVFPLGLLGVTL